MKAGLGCLQYRRPSFLYSIWRERTWPGQELMQALMAGYVIAEVAGQTLSTGARAIHAILVDTQCEPTRSTI